MIRPRRCFRLPLQSALGIVRSGRGRLGNHFAIDDRELLARLFVHADGLLGAVVAVGHVVADHFVLAAKTDLAARLAAGAHRASGPIRVAVGHVVGDGLAGGARVGNRAALAFRAVHDLATDMVAVDAIADVATGDSTGHGRGLLAAATADLVAHETTDHRTSDRATDVAVAFRGTFLHDDV